MLGTPRKPQTIRELISGKLSVIIFTSTCDHDSYGMMMETSPKNTTNQGGVHREVSDFFRFSDRPTARISVDAFCKSRSVRIRKRTPGKPSAGLGTSVKRTSP